MFNFVNFDDDSIKDPIKDTSINTKPIKQLEQSVLIYDKTTTEFYRINRLLNTDPILNEKVPSELNFKFYDKWDPLSGIRHIKDEIGPLCFNAFNLYKFYIKNRHNGLWIPPTNDATGYYQGYYGDLVGAGKDLNINNRGSFPEKYLFRLPIIDCYLSENHNHSLVTMGPILNNNEIDEIDNLIINCGKYKNLPKLCLIKKWYDKAITDIINYDKLKKKYNMLSERDVKDKYNRKYVDKLVNCKINLL
jgi:hypothetical protein